MVNNRDDTISWVEYYFFSSKSQGAIEISAYGVEFCTMKSGVEEISIIHHMLRYMGIEALCSSVLLGGNLWIVKNNLIPDSKLKIHILKHISTKLEKSLLQAYYIWLNVTVKLTCLIY